MKVTETIQSAFVDPLATPGPEYTKTLASIPTLDEQDDPESNQSSDGPDFLTIETMDEGTDEADNFFDNWLEEVNDDENDPDKPEKQSTSFLILLFIDIQCRI